MAVDVTSRLDGAPTGRRALMRTGAPLIGATLLLGLLVAFAIVTPLAKGDAGTRAVLEERLLPPLSEGHLFGTDELGRDLLTRVADGLRWGLLLSTLAVGLGGLFGTIAGLLAAWSPRVIDPGVRTLADAQLAFPFIVLAIVIGTAVGAGTVTTLVVLAAWVWPLFARMARAEAMAHLRRDYVKAARSLGASELRICVAHVVPNISSALLVAFFISVPEIIIAESTLSFIGVGVPPDTPTLGTMVAQGRLYLDIAWWVPGMPTLTLLAAVLVLNHFGTTVNRLTAARNT